MEKLLIVFVALFRLEASYLTQYSQKVWEKHKYMVNFNTALLIVILDKKLYSYVLKIFYQNFKTIELSNSVH